MADNFRLVDAKDTVYTLNGYGALSGLQRFDYNYSANEEHHDEIGNAVHTATSFRPETSLSFEVTDTGTLAALLARIHYDYSDQDYTAGVGSDVDTNAFSFDETAIQNMIFTAGEYKAPGGIFTDAKLFPFHFLTSINISLTAEAVGSVSIDAQGSLFKPLYKPYHTTRAISGQYATGTTFAVAAGWDVGSGTHGILAVEVNNKILAHDDVAWSAAGIVTITNGDTIADDDRIMAWLYERTPGAMPTIDYVNSIRFVKADRVNIWLVKQADVGTISGTNNYLRVQSTDITVNIPRDELMEIAKNERGTATFYRAPRYPLEISGQIRVLETTLHKWAELQNKTLNEAVSTNDPVNLNNVLNSSDFGPSALIVEWYRYGDDDPIQRVTLDRVSLTGYNGTQEVTGRKEATWDFTTSEILVEGFDPAL